MNRMANKYLFNKWCTNYRLPESSSDKLTRKLIRIKLKVGYSRLSSLWIAFLNCFLITMTQNTEQWRFSQLWFYHVYQSENTYPQALSFTDAIAIDSISRSEKSTTDKMTNVQNYLTWNFNVMPFKFYDTINMKETRVKLSTYRK